MNEKEAQASREQNILIQRIMWEDREREKLYPLPSLVNLLSKEFGRQNENLSAERILGRILDKIKLADEFVSICPLYYDMTGTFWKFNKKERYWEITDEIDILNWINNAAEVNIISSRERTEILNALKQVARAKKPKELDRNYIQIGREIVDMDTGDRIPADESLFCTNPIPYRITGNIDVSKFDVLFSSWVRAEDVEKLYEIIAFCFLPHYFIERIICLHGSGSNGKSVYRSILRKLIGEKNTCSTSLEQLTRSRFETAKLYKKLLCEMGETNLSKIENTQVLKRLVSGKDLVGGEWKNKKPFDFLNYAKLIISTNNLPPTDDKTDGFYRKWLIVEFPNTFSEEKDILKDLNEEDFENLTSYCIMKLDQLLKKRQFSGEGSFLDRRSKYESLSNPLDRFMQEYLDLSDPDADIPKWEFYKRLSEWLKESRLRTLSEVSVSKYMHEKGITDMVMRKEWYDASTHNRSHKSVRVWRGIKWK